MRRGDTLVCVFLIYWWRMIKTRLSKPMSFTLRILKISCQPCDTGDHSILLEILWLAGHLQNLVVHYSLSSSPTTYSSSLDCGPTCPFPTWNFRDAHWLWSLAFAFFLLRMLIPKVNVSVLCSKVKTSHGDLSKQSCSKLDPPNESDSSSLSNFSISPHRNGHLTYCIFYLFVFFVSYT